jgi:hypothetical protein
VCDGCNEYFGRNLEFHLGRDSTEAVHRLQHGIKKASEHDEVRYERIRLTVEEPGVFQGATVRIGRDAGSGVQPIPVPQVGFRRRGESRFTWILEAHLDEETASRYREHRGEIRVIGPESEDRNRLIARIRELGIPFNPQPERQEHIVNERHQAMIVTEAEIDIPLQRAIAKVGFNFAAYLLGAEFVTGSNFDRTRYFIRRASPPGFQVVTPSDKPILTWDSETLRQTTAHIIVIEWDDRDTLVVRFSPFNFITYRIVLCSVFHGIWRRISVGYAFDHDDHVIIPLTSIPMKLIRDPLR